MLAMKVTSLQTMCLSRLHELENQWFSNTFRVPKADCVIVIVETDEGLTGIGEACAYGGPEQIKDWVGYLQHELVGSNPLDLLTSPVPHFRSRSYDCAVSGIDCALWDIRGQAAGKPVGQLLVDMGLSSRTAPALSEVKLYASSGCRYDWRDDPRQLIGETLGYVRAGYPSVKVRIGTYWDWDGVTVDRFLGLMRELHQAVRAESATFGLAVDGNQRLTLDQSLVIAKELDRLGFAWFEEPIPQMDVEDYAKIAASVDIPITGGEQFTTAEQFRHHFERHAYDIAQPDVGMCGITEGLKIARYAEKYGIKIIPHNWHNGLMTMANAHFVAALPDPIYCELCMIQGPLQWAIFKDKPVIADGRLHLGNKPGLGVTLAADLPQRFPYFSGSWAMTIDRQELMQPR